MIKLGYSIMMDVGLKNIFSWLTIEKLPNTFKKYISVQFFRTSRKEAAPIPFNMFEGYRPLSPYAFIVKLNTSIF